MLNKIAKESSLYYSNMIPGMAWLYSNFPGLMQRLESYGMVAGGAIVASQASQMPTAAGLFAASVAALVSTYYGSRATAPLDELGQRLENHDLQRAFRMMLVEVFEKHGLSKSDGLELRKAWKDEIPGVPLPRWIEDSLGPGMASLLAQVGQSPAFEEDRVPQISWNSVTDWHEFLERAHPWAAEQTGLLEDLQSKGIWWLFFHIRSDSRASAGLDQYVAAAVLARLEDQTSYTTGFWPVPRLLWADRDKRLDRIGALIKKPTWREIQAGYVFERRLWNTVQTMLSTESDSSSRVMLITAPSGSGKSIFLQYVAIKAHRMFQLPTFYLREEDLPHATWPISLPQNAIVIIDQASKWPGGILALASSIDRHPGVVVLADQDVCWERKDMRAFAASYALESLGGLVSEEKDSLIRLLDRTESKIWGALTQSEKITLVNSPERGELLVVLFHALTGQSLQKYVAGEMSNLERSCANMNTDYSYYRDAIIAAAWFGLGEHSCPEDAIRSLSCSHELFPQLIESIVPKDALGRKTRHRLFAEAILEVERVHRLGVLRRIMPDLSALSSPVDLVRSKSTASLELLDALVEWKDLTRVSHCKAAYVAGIIGPMGLPVLEKLARKCREDSRVLVAIAEAIQARGHECSFLLNIVLDESVDNEVLISVAAAAKVKGPSGLAILRRILSLDGLAEEVLIQVISSAREIEDGGLDLLFEIVNAFGSKEGLLVHMASGGPLLCRNYQKLFHAMLDVSPDSEAVAIHVGMASAYIGDGSESVFLRCLGRLASAQSIEQMFQGFKRRHSWVNFGLRESECNDYLRRMRSVHSRRQRAR